ncbi:MAG TPA: class I adenylate-forming enzyme family protein, partial [Acidimicrobiales bacterium]|nr:class I adenylate-forming enzyme family protein [Acidimicrobiales bacterium]
MSGSRGRRSALQVDQLRIMAEAYPDEIGYRVLGKGQLTFSRWDGEANRLARGLTARGIVHGDRVAIRLSAANALRWVIAYAAIHKAGGVAVPLDPRLAQAEVDRMFVHAHVVAQVADDERVGMRA